MPFSAPKKGITLYRTELRAKVKVYFVKNFDTMAWFFLFISIYYEYFLNNKVKIHNFTTAKGKREEVYLPFFRPRRRRNLLSFRVEVEGSEYSEPEPNLPASGCAAPVRAHLTRTDPRQRRVLHARARFFFLKILNIPHRRLLYILTSCKFKCGKFSPKLWQILPETMANSPRNYGKFSPKKHMAIFTFAIY
jgi:hypothetical protein